MCFSPCSQWQPGRPHLFPFLTRLAARTGPLADSFFTRARHIRSTSVRCFGTFIANSFHYQSLPCMATVTYSPARGPSAARQTDVTTADGSVYTLSRQCQEQSGCEEKYFSQISETDASAVPPLALRPL